MFLQFIIPYYGAADLLITAVNSILNQTDTNDIGLIVIDDNHTKDYGILESAKVWDFLYGITQNAFNKVNIVYTKNKQNLGVGPTRNRGLKMATAQYVAFLDSDDELAPRYVAFFREQEAKHSYNVFIGKYTFNNRSNYYIDNRLTWLHAKIYKLSFLRYNHIYFPPLRFNEDAGFAIMTHEMTKNICVYEGDEIIYFWKDNPISLTRSKIDESYSVECYTKSITFATKKVLRKYHINQTTRIPITIIMLYFYYCELLYNGHSIEKTKQEMQIFFDVVHNTEWYTSEKQKKQLALCYAQKGTGMGCIPQITLAQFVSMFEKESLNFQ